MRCLLVVSTREQLCARHVPTSAKSLSFLFILGHERKAVDCLTGLRNDEHSMQATAALMLFILGLYVAGDRRVDTGTAVDTVS